MSTRPVPINRDELRLLNAAEGFLQLRLNPSFQRIMKLIETFVESAQKEFDNNHDPRWDSHLSNVYRERRRLLNFLNNYMEATIGKRREVIHELFKSIGINDAAVIERNQDISLDFLSDRFNPEAQNETKNDEQ